PRLGMDAAEGLEHVSDLAVEADPLLRRQLPIERLLDQAVRERVASDSTRHFAYDPGRHRFLERPEEAIGWQLAHALEDVCAELAPDDRGQREHPIALRRQA